MPLECREHGVERDSVVWVTPLWRMNNVVLSRVELHVFALEYLFWVSGLRFQEARALCKYRG